MTARTWAALLLLGTAGLGEAHPPAGHLAIRSARTFDGAAWHEGAVVVLHGGRVSEVRNDGTVPVGTRVDPVQGAVLTPGLVDLDSALGLWRGRDEWHEAAGTDLRVVDGFAPDDREMEAWRRSGVTCAWLSPGRSGVVGGAGALVQPSPWGREPKVLEPAWGLSGSLAAAARRPERAPTSLPEQAALLAAALDGRADGGRDRVRYDDAASARLAARIGEAALLGLPEPGPLVDVMAAGGPLIVGGLGPGADAGVARAVARLVALGHPLGFGSDLLAGGPAAVRTAAARCVQAGVAPEAALSALTGTAASIARLPGGRGTLAPGAAADLVAWSDDPTAPGSRALVVWVGGEEVHRE